jgi:tRNA(Ile)-lysidine synthetase-like protein
MDVSKNISKDVSKNISYFWKSNSKYWIPITEEDKRSADEIITTNFFEYDYSHESLFGKVVYLDQFGKHFQRHLDRLCSSESISGVTLSDNSIKHNREIACNLVLENIDILEVSDEVETIFLLMPFKHLEKYDFIFTILEKRKFNYKEHPKLSKFFNDTYKKAFTYEVIQKSITLMDSEETYNDYDPNRICDYYPEKYKDFNIDSEESNKDLVDALKHLRPSGSLILSLSGGVDSMVLLACLVKLKISVVCVHLVYGNREESIQERNFIQSYCTKLGVKLYVYQIKYLRRDTCEREFYETMTRNIRFHCYQAVADMELLVLGNKASVGRTEAKVLLGHIQEDVIENVWSNLAKCQHLHNLKKMKMSEVCQGVTIIRPFINIKKDVIYNESIKFGIPYLKNTTPSWSNRGKFREHFYKATHDQFGESVDTKILEVASLLEKQASMLNTLLYDPIFKSWNSEAKSIDITLAVNTNVSENTWCYIFEKVCYSLMSDAEFRVKPSIHAVKSFTERIQRFQRMKDSFKMPLRKDLTVEVKKIEDKVMLTFI